MIWMLRNIGMRLWITTLIVLPLSFYILPGLIRFFPGISPITTGFVMVMVSAVMTGFLMHITAIKTVAALMKEGQAWERSGIFNKAEKNYIKALRIYDTFLLWPFSAKKTTRIICGTIAKFELNSSIENQNFKLGTAVYLKINPGDREIARLWLERLRRSKIVTSFEQEVLSVLAEKHSTHRPISDLMVDIFLGLDRRDFIAKKLYREALKDSASKNKYSRRIEELIEIPDKTILGEVSYIKPEKKLKKITGAGKNIQTLLSKCVFYLKNLWRLTGSVLHFFVLSAGKFARYLKENKNVKKYLKLGFLLIVSTWLLFFMINTLSHILKSKAVEEPDVKIQIQVPKPFTIQVAAYLKYKYAARYVAVLKKKGIDAIIKEVGGGGKTWFVVRVSEFTDKKSATAYGQALKRKKIIDDFFVNNK